MNRIWLRSRIGLAGILLFIRPLAGQEWSVYDVDPGAKPSLELSSGGIPHISYMLETHGGFVKHATWNDQKGEFDTSLVNTGYFYGPLDLALDLNDSPHISYHDHSLPDQVHSFLEDQSWINEPVPSDGHDGWDNSIIIDGNGNPHTSTIDPSGFGGVGVEYAYFNGTDWSVEAVGSAPIMYANATSIRLDSLDQPHITYYDDGVMDLMLAVKESGTWRISRVDSSGDVGRFSSLRIDSLDMVHVSYYQQLSPGTGLVKYANESTEGWVITTIDTLEDIDLSYARNLTSLALDSKGFAQVAYCDQSIMKHALFDGQSWVINTVLTSPDSLTLGQLTSLQLDNADIPHIAYYEVTSAAPLEGNVKYATRKTTTGIDPGRESPNRYELLQNYPNPFNPSTTITYGLNEDNWVSLKIYNTLGQEVATLVDNFQKAGYQSVVWNGRDNLGRSVASGIYLYRMRAGEFVETRKLILLR